MSLPGTRLHGQSGAARMLLPMLASLLLTYARSTEVRWLNPERGPTRGGTGVHIKGKDFKHAGLGILSCRFHRTVVPAQVMSSTLIKCNSPAVQQPAQVDVVVMDGSGVALSGEQLLFDYFECDARECRIGDYVPLEASLTWDRNTMEGFEEEDNLVEGVQAATEQREEVMVGLVGADDALGAAGDPEAVDEVAAEKGSPNREKGADELGALSQPQPEQDVQSSSVSVRASKAAGTAGRTHSLPIVDSSLLGGGQSSYLYAYTAKVIDVTREGEQGLGDAKGDGEWGKAEAEETAAALAAEEMSDLGYSLVLVIGILGLYIVRLFVAALAGQERRPKILPELAAKIQSIDTTHLDISGKETAIEAERPSSTTTSTPALERANSMRPNERGVRKQAALGRTSMFEDGTADEEESLGHLTWLISSDANSLRDLQIVLAGLKNQDNDPGELVMKLQAFDARRLLHSEVVCRKALVHAGLSLDAAEAVSRQLYCTEPQHRDVGCFSSSPPTPLSSAPGSRAASPGRQSPGRKSPVFSSGPRRTGSANFLVSDGPTLPSPLSLSSRGLTADASELSNGSVTQAHPPASGIARTLAETSPSATPNHSRHSSLSVSQPTSPPASPVGSNGALHSPTDRLTPQDLDDWTVCLKPVAETASKITSSPETAISGLASAASKAPPASSIAGQPVPLPPPVRAPPATFMAMRHPQVTPISPPGMSSMSGPTYQNDLYASSAPNSSATTPMTPAASTLSATPQTPWVNAATPVGGTSPAPETHFSSVSVSLVPKADRHP